MSKQNTLLALYGYWRSSSSYRVRIALNLKGLEYEHRPLHLVKDGGEQHRPAYRQINPLGLVPALVHGDQVVVHPWQSVNTSTPYFRPPPCCRRMLRAQRGCGVLLKALRVKFSR